MNELRLLFARTGDTFAYRLATSWGGGVGEPQPFVPFLKDEDYDDLRWYLEEYLDLPMGGAKVRAQRVEDKLGEWGRTLFEAVFGAGDHRNLYHELLRREPPWLLTIGTRDLDVLRLPWELLAEPERGPLTRLGITVRRQLESAGPSRDDRTGTLPLRILLIVSRPDDTGFLDPRRTTGAMLDALAPLGSGVVVDFCRPATLDRMEEMLREADAQGRPYHIVHFDGHGTFLPVIQSGALYFERESMTRTLKAEVRADLFGALLARHRVPLAILEACRSGQVGHMGAFRGVAQALVEAGVGSVLAMSHAVHVEATRILLARFYAELAAGATIGQALEQGRTALAAKPERWLRRGPGEPAVALADWFLPQLYQLGPDRVLVPKDAIRPATRPEEARRAPAQGSEPGAFPGMPMYGFVGRAHELHRIERRLLQHRAVLLHAMGGMGKTSLAREAAFWGSRTGLFPDGACFVSFEQGGGAVRAVQVLGAYFEGVEFEKRPAEEQYRRARELFQTKRVLVVWDNFESVLPAFQEGEAVPLYSDEDRAEIHELFEMWTEDREELGRLLITCRPEETGLGDVCAVELRGLAQPDALALLYEVMQRTGVTNDYDRQALVDLLKAVEMHPLSIELVGPHLKNMSPAEIVADFDKLLDEFKGDAGVERNRSLKASIEFSLRRLSNGSREAAKWLGLFRGGVCEHILLMVSQMNPGVWEETRRGLEATALMRMEQKIDVGGKPYFRLHPTLALATGDGAAEVGARERYVGVYLALAEEIYEALRGSNPRRGMEVMVREEASLQQAVGWALELGAYDRASAMGNTLGEYFERAGRLREKYRLATWLADELRKGGFSEAVANGEMDEARELLSQGEPRKGIEKIEALVARLRTTMAFDPALALAGASLTLGDIYNQIGEAQKAVPVLKDAVRQWETLVAKAQAAGESTDRRRASLAATLGNLANALCSVGTLSDALTAAERGISISRERGAHRSVAVGLCQSAEILARQGRFADADTQYDKALLAAKRAGDQVLEGTALQNQGRLAGERGQLDRAAKLHQNALRIFQDIHHEEGIMLSCNLRGMVEQDAGRVADARGWYERSLEIAKHRGDQKAMGVALQNLGIVCQEDGEAARKQRDEARARERFSEAAQFVGESLALKVERQDEPGMAYSYSQLARIHALLGDFDKAEGHAHRARDIRERHSLKEASIDYDTLAALARARNNPTEAVVWDQKRDALLAELRRRAGAPAIPLQTIVQLAVACAQAGLAHEPLGAFVEKNLVALATWPAPYDALVPFLRALAAGELPSLPGSLPRELADRLGQVLAEVRSARSG